MIRLFIEKIKLAFQKRTKIAQKKKCYNTWKAKGYNNTPDITIIFQTHNKSLQICHVLPKIRACKLNTEIIVIDDGSSVEHTQRLTNTLTGANEFMLRCNDLYENITYDRTIRMANGRYIALLQDDDDFTNTEWIDRAVKYFEEHPKMVILGGNWRVNLEFIKEDEQRKGTKIDDDTKDFNFAVSVNRAPMWINKPLYQEHLHNIDYNFAPFQYDDDELCLRAWTNGLQVGWYDAKFKSLTAGGMRLWNEGFIGEQVKKNGHLLYQMYADKIDEIKELVENCNSKL